MRFSRFTPQIPHTTPSCQSGAYDSRIEASQRVSLERTLSVQPTIADFVDDTRSVSSARSGAHITVRERATKLGHHQFSVQRGDSHALVRLLESASHVSSWADAFAPFIERARTMASSTANPNCAFRVGDVRETLEDGQLYDAVLLIAVGPVLADYAATVKGLRRAVRPGGLLLIGEASLAEEAATPPDDGSYSDRRRMENALTASGDAIEATALPADGVRTFSEPGLGAVQRRAEEIVRRRPDLAGLITRYIEDAWLNDSPATDAIWMLRKCAD